MPLPLSLKLPPRYVEYTRLLPDAFSFVTKTSQLPALLPYMAEVVGKLEDNVYPVIWAFPDSSTAIPLPKSSLLPPRYVEYARPLPDVLSFITKASLPPALLLYLAEAVGKSEDSVTPVT